MSPVAGQLSCSSGIRAGIVLLVRYLRASAISAMKPDKVLINTWPLVFAAAAILMLTMGARLSPGEAPLPRRLEPQGAV